MQARHLVGTMHDVRQILLIGISSDLDSDPPIPPDLLGMEIKITEPVATMLHPGSVDSFLLDQPPHPDIYDLYSEGIVVLGYAIGNRETLPLPVVDGEIGIPNKGVQLHVVDAGITVIYPNGLGSIGTGWGVVVDEIFTDER